MLERAPELEPGPAAKATPTSGATPSPFTERFGHGWWSESPPCPDDGELKHSVGRIYEELACKSDRDYHGPYLAVRLRSRSVDGALPEERIEGSYVRGRREGKFVERERGIEITATFCEDEYCGPWTATVDGRDMARGAFEYGDHEGAWTVWTETGAILFEGEFGGGDLERLVRYSAGKPVKPPSAEQCRKQRAHAAYVFDGWDWAWVGRYAEFCVHAQTSRELRCQMAARDWETFQDCVLDVFLQWPHGPVDGERLDPRRG